MKIQVKINEIWTDAFILGIGEPWTDLGAYYDVPERTYHEIDACNASRLQGLVKSHKHLDYAARLKYEPTDEMILGSAIHARILEGEDEFMNRWARGLDRPKRSNQDKALHKKWEDLCRKEGKQILRHQDYERLEAVVEDIQHYDVIKVMLGRSGTAEQTLVWFDTDVSLICKARVDWIWGNALWDIKTTGYEDIRGFANTVASRDYHLQGMHYLDGASSLGIKADDYRLVVIQTVPPYEVCWWTLADRALSRAQDELSELKRAYAQVCRHPDTMNKYEIRSDVLDLPEWKYRQPIRTYR